MTNSPPSGRLIYDFKLYFFLILVFRESHKFCFAELKVLPPRLNLHYAPAFTPSGFKVKRLESLNLWGKKNPLSICLKIIFPPEIRHGGIAEVLNE